MVSTRLRRVLPAALVALTVALGLPLAAAAGPARVNAASTPRPTVLLGVAGLRWADIGPRTAPTLWGLVDQQAVASLSVRSVRPITCPVDGWLTVSAGRRAADPVQSWCRPLPQPRIGGDGATVPGWAALRAGQQDLGYDASPGLLADALAGGAACATAVGPGGALALADEQGQVARYLPDLRQLTGPMLRRCPLAVVDLGSLPVDPTQRRAAVRRLDTAVAEVRSSQPTATLYVAGVADTGPDPAPGQTRAEDLEPPAPAPGLRVALWAGPVGADRPGAAWMSSQSTRWTGLVQLLDVAPLLTASAGVPAPDGFVGRPWQSDGTHPAAAAETVSELVGAERAAQVFRVHSGPFFLLQGLIELLVFGAAYAILRSRQRPGTRRMVLRFVQLFALAGAALPVASFLANLFHWWRTPDPTLVLWPTIVVVTVALALLAAGGPWRRRVYGPPTVVAAVTVAVLGVDVLTGSVLQRSSLLGLSPLTAGRFYGFGNIAYAVFAAGCLVLAAGGAQAVADHGASRRLTAAVPVVVGIGAVAVGGAPFGGADFGGVVASICGFSVLTLGVLGVRLSWQKAVLVALLAVASVAFIAWLDWLRPAESRTHFGEFVQSVLDGTAGATVLRKGSAALGTLIIRPYYSWLVPLVSVYFVLALRDPVRARAAGLVPTLAAWPLLRPLVWAGLVTGFVGFAVNDSGIIVPGLLLTVAIPLVVAAMALAVRQYAEADPPPAPLSVSAAPRPAP